ncbi:hypothetical protein [Sedimentibacter sp.]|uniref:hypothetical protein n=1 Tax=Sedimentibacter sp. TaxID=1960295 RepID=UPI0028A619A7|nr:hypothetical protein [Sedimentibacter sp.]
MKKIKRFLTFLLTICLICLFPINVYAAQVDLSNNIEIYADKLLEDYTFERVIGNGSVTVFIKSMDGTVQHILINNNGNIYLDGELINNRIINNAYAYDENSLSNTIESITWGPWQSSYQEIETGGLTTVIIAGLILLFAPWISVKVAAVIAGAVAGKYDIVGIDIEIRYGTDDEYLHYQRYTDFYGDGEHVYGPYYDTGKTAL